MRDNVILVVKLAIWVVLCYFLFVTIFPIPEDASDMCVMEDNSPDEMPKEKEMPKRRKEKTE